jgi:hypothetical protein
MSSIDHDADKALRAFHARRLIPAAERLRDRQVRFFEMGPRRGAETYFRTRDERCDYVFEYRSNRLAAEIAARWQREQLPELVELSPELVKLLDSLAQEEDEWSEVSPFIYAMF